MDSDNLNENSNSDFAHPNNSNLDSDVLESQFEIPATNIPILSTNQLSSQIDNFG